MIEWNDAAAVADKAFFPSAIDRRWERKPTKRIAMIRLPDDTEISTSVKNITAFWMRLAVPQAYVLPEQFMSNCSSSTSSVLITNFAHSEVGDRGI
ncbi:hypothetical protein MKK63_08635 [Methylobacterium sp. J-088]|uniref:hypothetical protein n=1 Tax=Methylobacterium sp. J-088 TaxID=2836664 RepID=UPI001FB87B0E|nr:hypothetical protein [Methylobacterium sp. J-088]MCJ2062773.1 hypothetical protein [Methylobacterium sp. J-088]